MKRKVLNGVVGITFAMGVGGCKPRAFNQSRMNDLAVPSDTAVTVCQLVSPSFDTASSDAKAAFRVSCTGQCNGTDYRGKKFYVLNEEKVAGLEFAVTTSAGVELRNLYVFSPTDTLLTAVKGVTLDAADVQRSLAPYGLDPANITNIAVPVDAKILLLPGTRASLSVAGLLDGGTLDCGGQPVEGAVDMEQFKTQNSNDVRNSLTAPK